jgi:hypothetical protein
MRNELNVIKSTSNNNKKDDEGHHNATTHNNTKQGLTFYLALLKPPSKA